jgi:hypothetical protein
VEYAIAAYGLVGVALVGYGLYLAREMKALQRSLGDSADPPLTKRGLRKYKADTL